MTRQTVPKTEDIALESLEEHHIVKWVLSELDGMDPSHERFDAKVTVLIENVRHHIEEEETEYFPIVRDELGRNALRDLGEAMASAKAVAPTHPHPNAPDAPPGNLLVGTAAGVVDRVGDTVSGVVQGGASVVGDLVATILRRKTPLACVTGGKSTRATADKVRARAASATDNVTEAATSARRTVTATTKTATRGAKAGAKGTGTSARKATKRTATTAKRGATTTGRKARKSVKKPTASATRRP